jgi:hypothetical protein
MVPTALFPLPESRTGSAPKRRRKNPGWKKSKMLEASDETPHPIVILKISIFSATIIIHFHQIRYFEKIKIIDIIFYKIYLK